MAIWISNIQSLEIIIFAANTIGETMRIHRNAFKTPFRKIGVLAKRICVRGHVFLSILGFERFSLRLRFGVHSIC